jgi:hypothetical protein
VPGPKVFDVIMQYAHGYHDCNGDIVCLDCLRGNPIITDSLISAYDLAHEAADQKFV